MTTIVIIQGSDEIKNSRTDINNNFASLNTNKLEIGQAASGQYSSAEFDNGNITGATTIDWSKGNVQYATMTGDVTLTFQNALSGGRYILHLAGAHTPTFPASVRWSGGTTPTPTGTSGHKDIYTFIYSAKEALFDGLQSPNYAIT